MSHGAVALFWSIYQFCLAPCILPVSGRVPLYLTWSHIITLQYVRPQEDLDHSRQTPDAANTKLMDHIYLQMEQELIACEL